MSRLFIEFYLDEDVSALLAKLLRSRGFVATSAQEAGMLGCSDEDQFAHAAILGQSLLTHNRVDFEALAQRYYKTGRTHSGLVIAVRRPPYEILRRLLKLLDKLTADEMENQIYYI